MAREAVWGDDAEIGSVGTLLVKTQGRDEKVPVISIFLLDISIVLQWGWQWLMGRQDRKRGTEKK